MWKSYKNGNYEVSINDVDGSKIRFTEDDEFIPRFPESMDIKITNCCDKGCPFCHEGSSKEGKHADIDQNFLNSLRPYQELALGGGNVLSHPKFDEFLRILKDKRVIPSITLNQDHLLNNFDYVKSLYDDGLIYGIGVSLTDSKDPRLKRLKELPTAVLHVINGLFDRDDLFNLRYYKFNILILGYKNIGRGIKYLKEEENVVKDNMRWLANNLPEVFETFNITSFDNLALEQLPVRDIVSEEDWQSRYMGDDGNFTFYIDMVNKEFAVSSSSLKREPINNRTIEQMFNIVRLNKEKYYE